MKYHWYSIGLDEAAARYLDVEKAYLGHSGKKLSEKLLKHIYL